MEGCFLLLEEKASSLVRGRKREGEREREREREREKFSENRKNRAVYSAVALRVC